MEANEPRPNNSNVPYQRWYDKQQTVSKSVKLLETFPMEYQEVLGDTIIRLAEKHCKVGDLLDNLRALGPEKVLNLFKAKSKGRGYDQNETVHKAMNCMYVLPDDGRIFIATQMIEVVGYLFEYFSICRETRQATSMDVVKGMSAAFIRGHLKDTVDHLARFYPSMNLPNGPTLRAIRARIAQGKARAYRDEMAKFQTQTQHQTAPLTPFQQAAALRPATPLETGPLPETNPIKPPKSADEEAVPIVKPGKPNREKDETVAQDNRGMKIRLDKFEF